MSKKKLLLTIALTLVACNQTEDKSSSEYQGRTHAQSVKPEIYEQYLNCYPLDKLAKQQCMNKLAAKYIDENWQEDNIYVISFQHETEKLGFKHFINNLGLPCELINDGPKFIEDKKAYLVQCKSNYQYFMRFNYSNKEWSLVNNEGDQ